MASRDLDLFSRAFTPVNTRSEAGLEQMTRIFAMFDDAKHFLFYFVFGVVEKIAQKDRDLG